MCNIPSVYTCLFRVKSRCTGLTKEDKIQSNTISIFFPSSFSFAAHGGPCMEMELWENAQPGHLPKAGPAKEPAGAAAGGACPWDPSTRAGTAALLFPVWLSLHPPQRDGDKKQNLHRLGGRVTRCPGPRSTRFSTKVAHMFASLDGLSLAGQGDYVGWCMWKQMLAIIRNGQQRPGVRVKTACLCVRWWRWEVCALPPNVRRRGVSLQR